VSVVGPRPPRAGAVETEAVAPKAKATMPDLVDLHVHTTASDGLYRPAEVVRLAAEAGLRAVAITDHDTTAGLAEALAAGPACGVEVVPGVEVSTEFPDGTCHILGYFVDPAEEGLARLLEKAREGRARRNARILERLRDLGFDLAWEDLRLAGSSASVTRAHFAEALVRKGYARSWDEAFDRYLGPGRPAFVPRRRVEPEVAVAAIRGAGGLAALAHPRQLNRSVAETEAWVARLAEAGIEALEVSSPDHTAVFARHYGRMAQRLGLIPCGGTDWHGREESGVRLGVGRGQMAVHYWVVEQMKARLAARRAGGGSG